MQPQGLKLWHKLFLKQQKGFKYISPKGKTMNILSNILIVVAIVGAIVALIAIDRKRML
jgi:hypothetical protein